MLGGYSKYRAPAMCMYQEAMPVCEQGAALALPAVLLASCPSGQGPCQRRGVCPRQSSAWNRAGGHPLDALLSSLACAASGAWSA